MVAPGDFVTPATVLADLWPVDAADRDTVRAFRPSLTVMRQRDVGQDVGYGLRVLAASPCAGSPPASTIRPPPSPSSATYARSSSRLRRKRSRRA
ncbi:MAG: hypothetical protein ACR2JY_18085 [Chloroflexota bacterium]